MSIHTPFYDATRFRPCNHVAAPNGPSATSAITPSLSHNDPHAPSPIPPRRRLTNIPYRRRRHVGDAAIFDMLLALLPYLRRS